MPLLLCSEHDIAIHNVEITKGHVRDDLKILCDNCEDLRATVNCADCKTKFCASCDEAMHRSRVKRTHTRVKMTSVLIDIPGKTEEGTTIDDLTKLNHLEHPSSPTISEKALRSKVCRILWDYENMQIPKGIMPVEVVSKFVQLGLRYGESVKIKAFLPLEHNAATINTLAASAVEVVPVIRILIGERKESVDKKMISSMADIQPGETCIVVTNDVGFCEYMIGLTQRNIRVVLLYQHTTAPLSFAQNPFWIARHDLETLLDLKEERKIEVSICHHFTRNICDLPKNKCKFRHICEICQSKEHGAVTCPKNGAPGNCQVFYTKSFCKYAERCNLKHICGSCKKDCSGQVSCEKCVENAKTKRCNARFFCQEGLRCKLFHTESERNAFAKNGGTGVRKYRTEECRFGQNCTKDGCGFAHTKDEYVCMCCAARGDHLGPDCPTLNDIHRRIKTG